MPPATIKLQHVLLYNRKSPQHLVLTSSVVSETHTKCGCRTCDDCSDVQSTEMQITSLQPGINLWSF